MPIANTFNHLTSYWKTLGRREDSDQNTVKKNMLSYLRRRFSNFRWLLFCSSCPKKNSIGYVTCFHHVALLNVTMT